MLQTRKRAFGRRVDLQSKTREQTTLECADQQPRSVHLSSILHETSTDEDERPAENEARDHPTRVEALEHERTGHFESDICDIKQGDGICQESVSLPQLMV